MPLLRHYKNQMVIRNNSADKKKEFATQLASKQQKSTFSRKQDTETKVPAETMLD